MGNLAVDKANEWCNKARELLNWCSFPLSNRWTMGIRVEEITKALDLLDQEARGGSAKSDYYKFVDEYSDLGKRAKTATDDKKEEDIIKVSDEIEALKTRVEALI